MKEDLQYGLRQLRRNPVLSAIVIISLALGVGANTAIFSVVNAMMLRELPIADPARTVAFQYREPEGETALKALDHSHSGRPGQDSAGRSVSLSISWPSYIYMRERAQSVSVLAGFVPLGMFEKATAVVNGQPMFIEGDMVTSGYFPALGIRPIVGRGIVAADEKPEAPRVGVISYNFWTRVFDRNASVVGTSITVNTLPVTIVGVAPAAFTGIETGRSSDIWIQMGPRRGLTPWGGASSTKEPEVAYAAPDWWWLQVVGHVKPGVSIEQARGELERLFRASLLLNVDSTVPADKLPSVSLTPVSQGFNAISQRLAKPVWVLTVVVGLVLLVACANVATLLLVRATARRKEMSVRLAMGARRSRLIRQLVTEGLLYATGGCILGVVFAAWGSRVLFLLLTQGRDPVPLDVRLDPEVFLFAVVVSLLTTLLFAVAPALRATRIEAAAELKENASTARGESGVLRLRGGKLLVVAQMALSLPLVIGAGLFMRTLDNLHQQQLGFDPDKMLLFSVDPTKAGIKDARLLSAYDQIQSRIAAIPGVRGVAASRLGLITGWANNGGISLENDPPNVDRRKRTVHWNQVTPGFIETLGMQLVFGRTLNAHDTADSPNVAVVNEKMARQLFPGSNPVGRYFWFGRSRSGKPVEIVGVVRDAKFATVRAVAPPTAYVPYTQSRYPLRGMFFEVRTTRDPLALVPAVRKAVAGVVPGVPLGDVKTQTRQIEDSLGQERMYARLFAFFGSVALLLACVGLYGTMAYALGRRTREIGIRMALGAGSGRVLRSALAETIVMSLMGVTSGALLAWAGARYVRSLLFEVTPLDAPTLSIAVLVMLGVALAAGYLPACRASRLDPLRALREE